MTRGLALLSVIGALGLTSPVDAANGNRTTWDLPSGSCAAGCVDIDDQDRLLRHGVGGAAVTFEYDDRGRRISRRAGGATSTYDYDPFGNLRGVETGGSSVRYVVDALGRRIAREVDGVRTTGWVYGTGSSPLGQLDAAGRLELTFVYVTKSWVPDLALHRDGTLYRIVTDPVGSVRAVVNVAGVRIDGPYNPSGHPDLRAQRHAHVPGVTNADGTPRLPILEF